MSFALTACGTDSAAERPAGILVDTTHVATQDVPRVLRAVGTVEAENETTIRAEVEGQISRIVADEGARVARGEVVLQIDPTPFRLAHLQTGAALEQARAALENDSRLLERYEELLAAGALDQQSYDDVAARVKSERAAVAQAEARLAETRWDLEKSSVRAPFAGQIADRLVELGTYVSDGDELFELVDPTPVRVAFEVAEKDVGVLTVEDPVRFSVRTNPDEVYQGKVIYVSPSLDPESRTQSVKAEYPNDPAEITPGAFADIEVIAAVRKNAPVIPEEALVTEGEQSFVYVIQEGQAQKREITLGERLEGGVEVATGLEGGEVIVVAGQRELRDGAPVRIAERPAQPAGEVGPGREETP